MEGDKLVFRGLIASPDGKLFYDTTREGKPEDAVEMGNDAGMELKVRRGGSHLPAAEIDPDRWILLICCGQHASQGFEVALPVSRLRGFV